MADILIRPNPGCVPGDLQGQAAWFQNFSDQMQLIGSTLGYTPAELDRIKDDNNVVQFLAGTAPTVDGYSSAITSFRRIMLTRPIGTPTPAFPDEPALTLPVIVPTGIWDRLNKDIIRVRAFPTYTEETGSLLGTNPTVSEGIAPGEVKPTIGLSAAIHNYLFSTVVSGRYDADQWELWIRPSGLTEFQLAKTATGKSTDYTYNPGGETPGAVVLEVYVQLKRNDENYGQPSDIALVTVSP